MQSDHHMARMDKGWGTIRIDGETVNGDDLVTACTDLVGRTGATALDIRYQDDQEPVLWVAAAHYPGGRVEVDAALNTPHALYRLAERLIDGGACQHCGKATNVTIDFSDSQPFGPLFCSYVYDPELKRFRRSCEGDS